MSYENYPLYLHFKLVSMESVLNTSWPEGAGPMLEVLATTCAAMALSDEGASPGALVAGEGCRGSGGGEERGWRRRERERGTGKREGRRDERGRRMRGRGGDEGREGEKGDEGVEEG